MAERGAGRAARSGCGLTAIEQVLLPSGPRSADALGVRCGQAPEERDHRQAATNQTRYR